MISATVLFFAAIDVYYTHPNHLGKGLRYAGVSRPMSGSTSLSSTPLVRV